MSRDVTSDMQTQLGAAQMAPILLMKAEFDSGTVRVWNGVDNVTFNGEVYEGKGDLIGFSGIEESQEIEAHNVTVMLTGVKSSLMSLALSEEYQDRPATIWFGAVDASGLVADPTQIFKGRMDVLTIQDSGDTSALEMKCESSLIALTRPKERRYTDQDQKNEYPGDKGFEFVTAIQDTAITWGVTV